jgi:hypothetical protein
MTIDSGRAPLWRKHRAALILVGLVVLTGLWWLFRPERLFVNVQVDETVPAEIADIQPVFTGSLKASNDSSGLQGRVNIRKTGDGLELEISNLESKAGQSFTVVIAPDANSLSSAKTLGPVTPGGHEKLAIPPGLDLAVNKTVLLTDNSNRVLAAATLEPF